MKVRAGLSSVAAVFALAASLVVFGGRGADATQGQAILAGQTNTETTATVVQNTASGVGCSGPQSAGLLGCGSTGVEGFGHTGVYGFGDDRGVEGFSFSGDGVYGNGAIGVHGLGAGGDGVVGETTDGPSGVSGHNTGGGNGVAGISNAPPLGTGGKYSAAVFADNTATGVGLWARNLNGGTGAFVEAYGAGSVALQVKGSSKFSTAGIAVIASGKKNVTVTLAGVTTTDFVLATVQGSGAFYVKNASAGSGQFTISINKAPTAPATVKVAYFVITA